MRSLVAGVVFLLLGFAALLFYPRVLSATMAHFESHEPFYSIPVPVQNSEAKLRYDSQGKGHYGANRDGGRKHQGIDLLVATRMPIFASKSGRVYFAGVGKGYGNYVELHHPDGRMTRYAHLRELCVQTGDWVQKDQVIGTCGKTGNASHPRMRAHLHFEIRENGKPINPTQGLLDPNIYLK